MKISGWISGEPGSKIPAIKVDIDVKMSDKEVEFWDYAISGLYDAVIANGLLTRNEDNKPTVNRVDELKNFVRRIGMALFGTEPVAAIVLGPEPKGEAKAEPAPGEAPEKEPDKEGSN